MFIRDSRLKIASSVEHHSKHSNIIKNFKWQFQPFRCWFQHWQLSKLCEIQQTFNCGSFSKPLLVAVSANLYQWQFQQTFFSATFSKHLSVAVSENLYQWEFQQTFISGSGGCSKNGRWLSGADPRVERRHVENSQFSEADLCLFWNVR